MKFLFNILLILLFFKSVSAENHLQFFIEAALKNNLKLNAERKNQKSIKQNINISRSEFLPSVSISGSQSSQQNSNRSNQSGIILPDSSNNSESQSVSVDQKIFQGFQGYNSIKKSQLESEQAAIKLKNVEQQILLNSAVAYYALVQFVWLNYANHAGEWVPYGNFLF